MSFWVLLVRIALLVLTFLAGAGAKRELDYHTKPLRFLRAQCNCGCKDCACNKKHPLFGLMETITEADLDRMGPGEARLQGLDYQ